MAALFQWQHPGFACSGAHPALQTALEPAAPASDYATDCPGTIRGLRAMLVTDMIL